MRGFFMGKRVLFCGLSTVDFQYFVDNFPESNQKIKTAPPNMCVGGPAANAAITNSFLGGESIFITGIGENHLSDFIAADFKNFNVEVIDMAINQKFMPIIASIVTTLKNGDRSVISHFPQSLLCNENLLLNLNFSSLELVLIDGFYPETALEICKKAQEYKIPVILDGGSWKPFTAELLSYIEIAICSENFLPPKCSDASETMQFLQQKGIKKIAITRGEKEILWAENGIQNTIAIKTIRAIDTLGAGDVFHGAFTKFYVQNNDFRNALEKSAITATFSTSYKGTRDWMRNFSNEIYLK